MAKKKEKDGRELVEDLNKFLATLKQERFEYEDTWQDISDLMTPNRRSYKWDDDDTKGEKYETTLYDTTALQSLKVMARGLMGTAAPQTAPWFKLVFERQELNQDKAASVWLDKVTRLFNHFLDNSEFYSALEQFFIDGGGIATACMWVVPHPTDIKVVFRTRHMKEIYIKSNQYGEVDIIYRRYDMQARDAIKEFGEDAFDEDWLEQAKESPMETYKFVHCVYPREDLVPGKIDSKNKPIASVHYMEDKLEEPLRVSGYNTYPYLVWRFETNPDEDYGTGPAWAIEPTVLRLNQERRDTLNLGHKIADPPMNVPAESLKDFRRNNRPGGRFKYDQTGRTAQPIVFGNNYPVTQDIIQDDRMEIQEAFMNNFFIAMLQRSGRNATATEINELAGEKTAMLSAITSRLNNEFFNKLFDRLWDIAQENRWLPPMPPSMQGMSGQIRVDYIGPLSQAMRRFSSTQGIMGTMQNLLPLSQVFPQMLDNVDPDAMALHLLEGGSMPSDTIKDPSQRDRERQARQQAAAQQQQMENMNQQADVLKKTEKAPEPGSPAEAMINQMIPGAGGQPG